MLVYRIEDNNGNGPYEYHSCGSYIHNSNHILPVPNSEREKKELRDFWNAKRKFRLSGDYREFQCGFSSLEQLFAWFDKVKLRVMANESDENLMISIYDVKETHMIDGYYQCIFLREDSRLAQRLKIDALQDIKLDEVLLQKIISGEISNEKNSRYARSFF